MRLSRSVSPPWIHQCTWCGIRRRRWVQPGKPQWPSCRSCRTRRCFLVACRTLRPRSSGRPSGSVRKTRTESSHIRRSAVAVSSGCPDGLRTPARPGGRVSHAPAPGASVPGCPVSRWSGCSGCSARRPGLVGLGCRSGAGLVGLGRGEQGGEVGVQDDLEAVAALAGGAAGRDEGLGQQQERVGVGTHGRRVAGDLGGKCGLLGGLHRPTVVVEDHGPGQAQGGVDYGGVVGGDPQGVDDGAVGLGPPAHRPAELAAR